MDNVKDSYSFYREIRRKDGFLKADEKIGKAEELIVFIYNEIIGQWPYKADNATFIREVKSMMNTYDELLAQLMGADREGEYISMVDAFIIIMGLCEYMKYRSFTNREYRYRLCCFLFNGNPTLISQQQDKEYPESVNLTSN